jgi:hypothetical protein
MRGMFDIRYYVGQMATSRLPNGFVDIEPVARAKIAHAITRMEQGNLSNVKSVGGGVLESRIDFGPGTGSISGAMARRSSFY